MQEQGTWDTTIHVLDELQADLQRVQDFAVDKARDLSEKTLGGPAVDVPNKVTSLGPKVLAYFGQGPGDELYDHVVAIQEELDKDIITSIQDANDPNNPKRRVGPVPGPDPGPAPPPEQTTTFGVIDP